MSSGFRCRRTSWSTFTTGISGIEIKCVVCKRMKPGKLIGSRKEKKKLLINRHRDIILRPFNTSTIPTT
jgi:hypothetical protein